MRIGCYQRAEKSIERDLPRTKRFGSIVCATALTFAACEHGQSAILISQYYEGAGSNKWIELYNNGSTAVDLGVGGFRLGNWSNELRQAWKTGTAPGQVAVLTGFIPANGVYVIANSASAAPSYAVNRAANENSSSNVFNGDDSVVLYTGSTYSFANVVDAFGLTSNSAENLSFSRATTISTGTNVDFVAADWNQFTNSNVDGASLTTDQYISVYKGAGNTVYWDANGASSAALGGPGTWDSSPKFTARPAGTTDSAKVFSWSNTANAKDAVVFSGTAGAVTVSPARTIGAMLFTSNGYTIGGSALTLDGSGVVETFGSLTATVNSSLLTSSGVKLRKLGQGTLILSANNAYIGATDVEAGKLLINGTHSGGGAFTVKSGATLGGTGSTGAPVVVESGGIIAPGTSVDDLGTGNLNLHGGAVFSAEVNFIQLSTSVADQIDVTGTVTLGDGVSAFPQLQFVATYSGLPGNLHTFVVVDNDNSDLISTDERFAGGTAVSSPPNATHAFDYIVGLLQYRVYYNANNVNGVGDGNDIVVEFTQVPEPSMLSLAAGTLLLGRRNRRR